MSSPPTHAFTPCTCVCLPSFLVQAAVVDASGGVETLLASGFEVVFEEPAVGQEGQTEG